MKYLVHSSEMLEDCETDVYDGDGVWVVPAEAYDGLRSVLKDIASHEKGCIEVENGFAAWLCGKARVALDESPVQS